MKKNYIAPSVESYMLEQADVISTSVSSIGDGEFGVRGDVIFGA